MTPTAVLDRLGVHLDVRRPLSTLNIALQQMVAIARAISTDARIVIMDEPTSSLDEREVEVLFDVIRGLKANGIAVIYISHRLDELYAVCDRVTIMRDGKTIDERPIAGASKVELVARMLGKEIGEVRRSGATGFQHRGRACGRRGSWSKRLTSKAIGSMAPASRSAAGRSSAWPGCSGPAEPRSRGPSSARIPRVAGLRLRGKPVRWRSPRDAIRAGFGL